MPAWLSRLLCAVKQAGGPAGRVSAFTNDERPGATQSSIPYRPPRRQNTPLSSRLDAKWMVCVDVRLQDLGRLEQKAVPKTRWIEWIVSDDDHCTRLSAAASLTKLDAQRAWPPQRMKIGAVPTDVPPI